MVMGNDPEAEFIRGLADIKELKKDIKSLKTRTTKLSDSIEHLHLMDFQEQINRLNDTITELRDKLLESNRLLAKNDVIMTRDRIQYFITAESASQSWKKTMRDWLITESVAAMTETGMSKNPIEVSTKFRESCRTTFKEFNPFKE